MKTSEEFIRDQLEFLYGKSTATRIWPDWQSLIEGWQEHLSIRSAQISEIDQKLAVLITYGDQVQSPHATPLKSLHTFLNRHLSQALTAVHILPFYPYSSDDGFSVIDYRQVDSALGSWQDIASMGERYILMFDAVVNHISRRSAWFDGFLRGDNRYQNYFIAVDPHTDLSGVVRPRALPLLTPVESSAGIRHVWTTFSDDQIDLNYANPKVLLEICDLLLFYVSRRASLIRLDAIAYLWKEVGTSCIHLPQTHRVVKVFRAILDILAPDVLLITETNVPHEENISYFGSPLPAHAAELPARGDEAQLVYQFPLAPLVLHSLQTGNGAALNAWASSLEKPFPQAMFFNFIASHDGIGVRPAEGLLSGAEINALTQRCLAHGGRVSYRNNPDGSQSVYELNITLYDALNDPSLPKPDLDFKRFLASQVIMLSLAGVPGVYFHSLIAARNCQECIEETGRSRSINRQKFQLEELESRLNNPDDPAARMLTAYTQLLETRAAHPAFHPLAEQRVLHLDPRLFTVVRTASDSSETVLCLVNLSDANLQIEVELERCQLPISGAWQDLLGSDHFPAQGNMLQVRLTPYQSTWLRTGL